MYNTARSQISIQLFVFLLVLFCLTGCRKDGPTNSEITDDPAYAQFESTGEEFLISALDEVESIGELPSPALQSVNIPFPLKSQKYLVSSAESDTTFVYGELTPDGFGAVVTERHTYPKGLLLITVRKSYGKPATKVITETRRFTTFQNFQNDTAQQSNVTELYGLSNDTIVTHVDRNGTIETYTFRLPVITRVTKPDGSVKITTRFAVHNKVVSEIRDGSGALVQHRESYGDSTGALTTYTSFPDASWRRVRVLGLSDGSVRREITTGP